MRNAMELTWRKAMEEKERGEINVIMEERESGRLEIGMKCIK